MSKLGRTLVIVNPQSRNGRALVGAERIEEVSDWARAAGYVDCLDVRKTEKPGHATYLAQCATGYHTVLVCGGDGVIHETVNGLMQIPEALRPTLGVIPFGNGNDTARSLGMSLDASLALEQLFQGQVKPIDIGECNGRFFIETLSFGLDAAIAMGTHQRRMRTGREGTVLFVEEGANQILFHRDSYGCTYTLDDEEPRRGSFILMAVQNGPTYGGGFKVTPGADMSDGMFDLCFFEGPCSLPKASVLFLMAKEGKHVGLSSKFRFHTASRIHLSFDQEPPAQVDGEAFAGREFDVQLHHHALSVLCGPVLP